MCVGELYNNDISHAAGVSVPQMCLHLSSTDPQSCLWITLSGIPAFVWLGC